MSGQSFPSHATVAPLGTDLCSSSASRARDARIPLRQTPAIGLIIIGVITFIASIVGCIGNPRTMFYVTPVSPSFAALLHTQSLPCSCAVLPPQHTDTKTIDCSVAVHVVWTRACQHMMGGFWQEQLHSS